MFRRMLVLMMLALILARGISTYAQTPTPKPIEIDLNTPFVFELTGDASVNFVYSASAGEYLIVLIYSVLPVDENTWVGVSYSSDVLGVGGGSGGQFDNRNNEYKSIFRLEEGIFTLSISATQESGITKQYQIMLSNPPELQAGIELEGTAGNYRTAYFIYRNPAEGFRLEYRSQRGTGDYVGYVQIARWVNGGEDYFGFLQNTHSDGSLEGGAFYVNVDPENPSDYVISVQALKAESGDDTPAVFTLKAEADR